MATKKPKAATNPPAKPAHRPTILNAEMTEALVRLLRLGSYVEQACAQVGIDKGSFYSWSKRGNREIARRQRHAEELERERDEDVSRKRGLRTEERRRRHRREVENAKLTKDEQLYVDFVNAVSRAQAEGENTMLALIGRAASGGAVLRRTTRTLADGTTSTTETLALPDWRAAAWRLEKRHPTRWGQQRLDVRVEGDVSVGTTDARQRLLGALARVVGGADSSDAAAPAKAAEDDDE